MSGQPDCQSFDAHAQAWLQYNESLFGQLRHALILGFLEGHLPPGHLHVLDVGGGTGELAAALAAQGHSVTLLDFSRSMLELAQRRCAGLDVTLVQAGAGRIRELFSPASFHLVACHSLLEFVDEPQSLLDQMQAAVRPGGVLSVVAGNRHHIPLRAALRQRDFGQARAGLDGEIPKLDLFGLPRRTYIPEELWGMLQRGAMQVVGEYGIRVFSDLLDPVPESTQDLLALELEAGVRLPYRRIARFIQLIARKGEPWDTQSASG